MFSRMARVLLIEDDYFLRAVLKGSLQEQGYAVVDVENASRATALHEENPFDVILTDLIMPERDGLELITEFRRRFPAVRIIAMSAGGQISGPDYLEIAKKMGAFSTLLKPITDQALASTLTRALA